MKQNAILLLLACTVIFASSCSEDPLEKKTNLLSRTGWKINSVIIDPPRTDNQTGATISELYPDYIVPCDRDDLWVFSEDNTFYFDEGADKCDPDAAQIYGQGNWQYGAGEDEIILRFQDSSTGIFFSILELTETSLKLLLTQKDSNGQTQSIIRTFEPAN